MRARLQRAAIPALLSLVVLLVTGHVLRSTAPAVHHDQLRRPVERVTDLSARQVARVRVTARRDAEPHGDSAVPWALPAAGATPHIPPSHLVSAAVEPVRRARGKPAETRPRAPPHVSA